MRKTRMGSFSEGARVLRFVGAGKQRPQEGFRSVLWNYGINHSSALTIAEVLT